MIMIIIYRCEWRFVDERIDNCINLLQECCTRTSSRFAAAIAMTEYKVPAATDRYGIGRREQEGHKSGIMSVNYFGELAW